VPCPVKSCWSWTQLNDAFCAIAEHLVCHFIREKKALRCTITCVRTTFLRLLDSTNRVCILLLVMWSGPGLLQAGPLFRKNVGHLIYEYPVTPPDCLHPTLSGLTRTVVIIDILLRTRAAMHTTIAAAAGWQFEASLSESNCTRVREYWSNTYMLNRQSPQKGH